MVHKTIFLPLFSAILGGVIALQFQPGALAEQDSLSIQQAHWAPGVNHGVASSDRLASTREAEAPAAHHADATVLPRDGFHGAAKEALDAVVHVRTAQTVAAQSGWSGFFRTPAQSRVQRGSGSGVILSSDGLIVTNHHVIEGADAIEIGLNDNRSFPAELIGSDPATDIAVLRIDADGLAALSWGNSDDVRVGDWVLAVGNPFDLTSTVTAGIVSAKARDIQLLRPNIARDVFPVESFIQTDAAVNPGNSGGALVDAQGKLIGINTAIASRTGSYSGYSFAVPANLAAKVSRDLIEFGEVQRAFLGVHIRPVDEGLARDLGLPDVSGVMVTGLTKEGGAAEAGLQEGDVILAVDGAPTPSLPVLLERVNRHRPGEESDIEVWRDGQTQRFTVELKDRFGSVDLATADDGTGRPLILGAAVTDGQEDPGVLVLDAGTGAFGRAGIPDGTRIESVDGRQVRDVAELEQALDEAKEAGRKAALLEGLGPDGNPMWFGVGLR